MAVLNVAEEPLEIVLVLSSILMLFALEGGVFDIGAAVLAPVLRLQNQLVVRGSVSATR